MPIFDTYNLNLNTTKIIHQEIIKARPTNNILNNYCIAKTSKSTFDKDNPKHIKVELNRFKSFKSITIPKKYWFIDKKVINSDCNNERNEPELLLTYQYILKTEKNTALQIIIKDGYFIEGDSKRLSDLIKEHTKGNKFLPITKQEIKDLYAIFREESWTDNQYHCDSSEPIKAYIDKCQIKKINNKNVLYIEGKSYFENPKVKTNFGYEPLFYECAIFIPVNAERYETIALQAYIPRTTKQAWQASKIKYEEVLKSIKWK